MADPRLFLTNAASRRPPHRGPGRVLTIMAAPRPHYGEAGTGSVPVLIPQGDEARMMHELVDARRRGELLPELEAEYRRVYSARLAWLSDLLVPGMLRTSDSRLVEDGATLLCSCSRPLAAEGHCHRAWAAPILAAAGWNIVLDGDVLP